MEPEADEPRGQEHLDTGLAAVLILQPESKPSEQVAQ